MKSKRIIACVALMLACTIKEVMAATCLALRTQGPPWNGVCKTTSGLGWYELDSACQSGSSCTWSSNGDYCPNYPLQAKALTTSTFSYWLDQGETTVMTNYLSLYTNPKSSTCLLAYCELYIQTPGTSNCANAGACGVTITVAPSNGQIKVSTTVPMQNTGFIAKCKNIEENYSLVSSNVFFITVHCLNPSSITTAQYNKRTKVGSGFALFDTSFIASSHSDCDPKTTIELEGTDASALTYNSNSISPIDPDQHKTYSFNIKVTWKNGSFQTITGFTFDVGCNNAQGTANGAFQNTATDIVIDPAASSDATGVYNFLLPTWDLDGCTAEETSIQEILITGTDGIQGTGSSEIFFPSGCTQPCQSVNLVKSALATVKIIKFKVKTKTQGLAESSSITSDQITLKLICDALSTSIIPTIPMGAAQIIYLYDSTTAYSFSQFTCSVSTCCEGSGHTLVYEVRESTTCTNLATGMDVVSFQSSPNPSTKPSDVTTKNIFSFKIFAKNNWGTEECSNDVTIKVECGSNSVTSPPTIGSYLGDYQRVNVGFSNSPLFSLPTYTSANTNCPITGYELVDANSTEIVLDLTVPPSFAAPDIGYMDTHQVFSFKIKVTYEGTGTWTSGQYLLDVGCSNTIVTFQTQSQSTTYMVKEVLPLSKFTYINPTIEPSYCTIKSNTLTEVMFESAPYPTFAEFVSGCTQPCTQVDIISTDEPGEITFKVFQTIDGDFELHENVLIKIKIECSSTSTTVVPPNPLDVAPEIPQNTDLATAKFIFAKFECPDAPKCCEGSNALTYKISSSNNQADPFTANGMDSTVNLEDATSGSQYVKPTSTAIVESYTFYIYAENNAGAFAFSEQITLSITCTPASTDITIGSFPSTYSTTQVVQASDQGAPQLTQFVFPDAASDIDACPIIGYRIVNQNIVTDPQSTQFNTPDPNTLPAVAIPVDKALDLDYNFYIVWIAKGGFEKISTDQMTLTVGCTPTMVITDPNFVASSQIGIGHSGLEVYTINPPVCSERPYCAIIKYEIIETKVEGNLTPGAAFLSASCGGSLTCTKVDIASTSQIIFVQFKIRTTFHNNIQFTSEQVTVQTLCELSGNIMINTFVDNNRTFWLNHTVENQLYFEPFTCTFDPVCCNQVTYIISSDNSTATPVPHPAFGTVQFNATALANSTTKNQTYSSQIDTSKLDTYFVFIYAVNENGVHVYSQNVSIKIDFPCVNDTFWLNATMPAANASFTFSKVLGWPVLMFNKETLEITQFKVDLFDRFEKLSPLGYCNITNFRIDKVVVKANGNMLSASEISKLYSVSPTGTFSILDFTQAYNNYQVYIAPYNSEIWGDFMDDKDAKHIADITFIQSDRVLPNFPPFFEKSLVDQELFTNQTSSVVDLVLPKILDNKNGTIKVTIQGLQKEFMVWTDIEKKLQVQMMKVKKSGIYPLTVILEDEEGGTTSVKWNIKVEVPPIEVPAFIFVPPVEEKEEEIEIELTTPILSAKIVSITALGTMLIQFNSTMQTNLNFTFMTELIDIYVLPQDGRDEEPSFNKSSLKLSWSVMSFQDKDLFIKLRFDNPLAISPDIEQDLIVFSTKELSTFCSPQLQRCLDENYKQISSSIKKQIPENSSTNNLKSSAETSQSTMKAMLVISFAMNLIMSGAMIYMLTMIRSLQMILHLPMTQVMLPGNVNMFFSILIPIVMFDIIDSEWSTELVFTFDFENEEENAKDMHKQMQDLGYDSRNSILNLGSVFVFAMFYLIQVLMYFFLKLYNIITGKLTHYIVTMRDRLFWGEFLGLMMEAYLEYLVSGYLSSQKPSYSTNGETASTILGYVSLVVTIIIMPSIFIWILVQPQEKLENKKFEKKWGTFYEGIKTESKYYLLFYLLFMLRRILFVSTCFGLSDQVLQIQAVFGINTAMFIFQGYHSPFVLKSKNIMEIFNEVCIHTASVHLIFFTDWVPDKELQYDFGWSMLSIIAICTVGNLLAVFWFGVKSLIGIIRKFQLKRQYKRELERMRKRQQDMGSKISLPTELLSRKTMEFIYNPKGKKLELEKITDEMDLYKNSQRLSTIMENSHESTPRPEKKFFGIKHIEFKQMSDAQKLVAQETFAYKKEQSDEHKKIIKEIKSLAIDAKTKKIINPNKKIAPRSIVKEKNNQQKEYQEELRKIGEQGGVDLNYRPDKKPYEDKRIMLKPNFKV